MNNILGTAQLGMIYGVSNQERKPSRKLAHQILAYAYDNGVRMFDTAPVYGNSESLLGNFIREKKHVDVISKIPRSTKYICLNSSVDASLKNLNLSRLYALLHHSPEDLLGVDGDAVFNEMLLLKDHGFVKKIGISAYTKDEIELVINRYEIDVVQLPINVFDQRLLEDNYLSILKKKGIEVHVRSIFCQGLLLMSIDELPKYFDPIKSRAAKYYEYLTTLGITKLQAALSFINKIDCDMMVFGVHALSHLKEILSVSRHPVDLCDFKKFSIDAPEFVNPSRWVL
jgi:aryl-alcohol dehydrogenase-like predicted oxidoreductase